MFDRSDYHAEAPGAMTKRPPAQVPCDCQKFKKAGGPDNGSIDLNRKGHRTVRNGNRSGSEEFCVCRHYSNEHELNGRCTMMVWDQSAHEPWEVDNQGRPVPARIAT